MCVVSNICCCACSYVLFILLAVVAVVWIDRYYKLKMKRLDDEMKKIDCENKLKIETLRQEIQRKTDNKEQTDK